MQEASLTFVWLDWVLLAILALSILEGFRQGLVKQALGFAGLFISLFLAGRWSPVVANWLNNSFNISSWLQRSFFPVFGDYRLEPIVLSVLSYLLVWLAVSIAIRLLGAFLDSVTRLPLISSANKLGGAILGALKGGVIVFIVASLISFLPASTKLGEIGQRSYIGAQVRYISPVLYQYLQELVSRIWVTPMQL
ncbi:MAG: CvpA family protein [Firmicutes bacterium]|nr:CvpA family protein [Bacillota bacterium]